MLPKPPLHNKILTSFHVLTKLSPISHLVTSGEFFAFKTFRDDFGTTLNDSPNSELDFRLCHAYHTPLYRFATIYVH